MPPHSFTISSLSLGFTAFSEQACWKVKIFAGASSNRIFPLRLLTAGLFLNIMGAIAPVAPVLNTPLLHIRKTRFRCF